jgi:alanyl-tRNA synthetase
MEDLMWTGSYIRESFLEFFEGKGHMRLPSASLIPVNDPTLLLIGAGMAPFKPMFRGEVTLPNPRVTTCQKCIRADDIERVGRTARHHTFFEMLGNFSFGDYFKEAACAWAWEYMTEVTKFDPARLWATIHTDDDEAYEIWRDKVGVPEERIVRLPDNFWGPIGQVGPCGPCSELIYDMGKEKGCGSPDCRPGCDCDRYLEVWNLVFTGLNKNEKGGYDPLPSKCIDTGLGFERLTMLLQHKPNPYETDLFVPVIDRLVKIGGKPYGANPRHDEALKIIADHARALCFMAGDGITPSNEGRGYVLRRLLRRAQRFGKVLGIEDSFLVNLVDPIVELMGGVYPELVERRSYITKIIEQEERNFHRTLRQGESLLGEIIEKARGGNRAVLAGVEVFRLYDTFGFPWEMTKEMALEKGLDIDEEGFRRALEEQKKRGRADLKEKLKSVAAAGAGGSAESRFTGYDDLITASEVVLLLKKGEVVEQAAAPDEAKVILKDCPFYGESGGQVGDTGRLEGDAFIADVLDTRKNADGQNVMSVRIVEGALKTGDRVIARVDEERRRAVMSHHTATHLLQAALRGLLGTHVAQVGSLVAPDYFRFDFSHYAALTPQEIEEVEEAVNRKIMEDLPVNASFMSMEEALRKGALAFFSEKYAEEVRLVQIEDYSKELCGGTHVSRTGRIGSFKILSESAVGTGTRRIEAVAGLVAWRKFREYEGSLKEAGQLLKVGQGDIPRSIRSLQESLKEAQGKIGDLTDRQIASSIDEIMRSAKEIAGVRLLAHRVKNGTRENLLKMGDLLKDRMGSGVIFLGTDDGGKAALLCMVTKDLVSKGLKAGSIIAKAAPLVEGSGGGRPETAQAGGKNPEKIPAAIEAAEKLVREELEKLKT